MYISRALAAVPRVEPFKHQCRGGALMQLLRCPRTHSRSVAEVATTVRGPTVGTLPGLASFVQRVSTATAYHPTTGTAYVVLYILGCIFRTYFFSVKLEETLLIDGAQPSGQIWTQ